jgi:hypothetical protein
MRYKGEYGPQELLSPGSNEWVPLDDEMKKQLAENPTSAVTFNDVKDECDDEDDDEDPEPGFCIRSGMPGLMTTEDLEAFSLGDVRIGLKDLTVTAKVRRLRGSCCYMQF